jgi:hypothetical protein
LIIQTNAIDKVLQRLILILLTTFLFVWLSRAQNVHSDLKLNDLEYFETRGLNVLVFSNWYDSNFSDAKLN